MIIIYTKISSIREEDKIFLNQFGKRYGNTLEKMMWHGHIDVESLHKFMESFECVTRGGTIIYIDKFPEREAD